MIKDMPSPLHKHQLKKLDQFKTLPSQASCRLPEMYLYSLFLSSNISKGQGQRCSFKEKAH